MSKDIVQTGGFGVESRRREDRAVKRRIEGLNRSKLVGLAQIETQAELQVAKVHAVGFVAGHGMREVGLLGQAEVILDRMCPWNAPRIQAIVDTAAMTVAQIVADTARKID